MSDNREKHLTDHDVQLFFETANTLLKAAKSDGEKSREATAILASFTNKIDTRLRKLENDVTRSISESTEITANRAAELLSVKFREADKAAEKAAKLYLDAEKKLNSRSWLYFAGAQLAFVLLMSVLMKVLVPSMDEIQQRRADLANLERQLEVGTFHWSTCGEKKEKCLRTDERDGKVWKGDDGSIWRIPWKE
ncbi:hypothetical protein [Photorhabdus tasmaniensis]|uniref:Mobilization protein n=1 Tax=Photorhabdus tasmaniensis TaxID=1004159 RepID=A0ABX0GNR6_9GAMM|nr:hypothetical protein [Photorhabdus tasmaniensis]NHB89826.1 hypothetical protein [Photorhabdus tasmaniensis]